MKYRKLRIAWSVWWGVVAVLVGVLWVRSFWRVEVVRYRNSAGMKMVVSQNGVLCIGEWYSSTPFVGWTFDSREVPDPAGPIQTQLGVAYFDERPRDVGIAVPHFLVCLACSVLMVVPWVRWRFRTSTLLIVTTVVAGLLGVVVWASRSLGD